MKYFLFSMLFMLLGVSVHAQSIKVKADSNGIYQISGMVVSNDDSSPIQFVSVRVNHTKQGVLTNREGFYSIPVHEQDTLFFTHAAYNTTKLVIRDYLQEYKGEKSTYVYVVNYMTGFSLAEQKIYPWKNEDELRTAIVNMSVDHNSLSEKARENLDPKVLAAIMQALPKDGEERYVVGRQMYYDNYKRQNLMPMAGLDVVAAAKLLQYIVQKTKERSNKDLNYWEK
jgi:hypothetical protein